MFLPPSVLPGPSDFPRRPGRAVERKAVTGMRKKSGEKTGKKDTSRRYKTPEELAEKINEYFDKCDDQYTLYSEAGLARHLGITDVTLNRWRTGEFCGDLQETVEMAFLRIKEQILTDERYSAKGMVPYRIFLLKQEKFGGYQDRMEAKADLSVNVKFGANMDESDFA